MPRARTRTSPPAMSASAARRPRTTDSFSILPAVPDVHYVAILHHVFLAFQAQSAADARGGLRAGIQQLIPANGLGADEVVLEIGMDGARGLRRFGPHRHRPCAAFVLTGGEEADEPQQLVALADEAHQAALVQSIAGEEIGG